MQILNRRDSFPHAEESAPWRIGTARPHARVNEMGIRRYIPVPPFPPSLSPSTRVSSSSSSFLRRPPCHSLLPASPLRQSSRTSQSRLLELLTLNPLLHIAAVEFNLAVHSHCFRTWNWIPGVNSRDFWACQPTSRWTDATDVSGRPSLAQTCTRVVFDACVRVNKHRRAVNRACATRRIVIDKQPGVCRL